MCAWATCLCVIYCDRCILCKHCKIKDKTKISSLFFKWCLFLDQVSSEDSDTSDKDSDNSDVQDGPSDADFWKGPLQEPDEKSREEEFDEYFQDLFL